MNHATRQKRYQRHLFTITNLEGEGESDEFYIKSGLNGRSYHDEIVKAEKRNPRKRRLKPRRSRDIHDKDHPQ